jgi:radical SAM family uncharacterized protein
VGGETNIRRKDWQSAEVSVALCFPDIYSIGMSHLGYQILYPLLNDMKGVIAERAYAPWPDMQSMMREHNIPLYTLESFHRVRDFDIVGFTLQSELLYTNILMMLDMADIPVEASDRTTEDPLIIAGGPGATNPEPLSRFVDLFFIGDAEETLPAFINLFNETKKAGIVTRKDLLLKAASRIEGLYAPALYEAKYDSNGFFNKIVPLSKKLPSKIKAARISSLENAPFPTAPIVPLVETIHDRITLEIMRGCTRGCRFCHAGMTNRPTRWRTPETLCRLATDSYWNTGHEEISLASLSSSDYPRLDTLLDRLTSEFDDLDVSISLPSLRVSDQIKNLVGPMSSVRKSGLTLAPEAGSERLRDVINKNISHQELLEGTKAASEAGWQLVKLYFMIGLPTETLEDIEGIKRLCSEILSNSTSAGSNPSLKLNVTISPFVPKPHTPFQWEPAASLHDIKQKIEHIRRNDLPRKVRFKFHNAERSLIEAVLARGDRRLGETIRKVWEKGGQFDAWDEHFNFQLWQEVLKEDGIDLESSEPCASPNSPYRRRLADEPLPWDHIDCNVQKGFLLREKEKAFRGEKTPDCRTAECSQCGACENEGPS